MDYAIIKTGGKQYKVAEGDTLAIEKLEAAPGDKQIFSDVLFVSNGSKSTVGSPTVSGASVEAEVLEQFRGEKVVAFKYRRRKGYHRTVGHRQSLTRVKITSIQG